VPAITERCDSVPVSSRGEVSVPRESPVYSNFPAAARAVPCVSVPRGSPVYSNHDGSMAACGSMEGNQSFSPTGIAGVLQLIKVKRVPGRVSVPRESPVYSNRLRVSC
jgi:hypothetical protein